jgi:ribosome-binding factor A
MQENKRQKQIAGLLQEELSDIFQRLGLNMVEGGLISISSVKITPDLLEARIYLSIFQADAKVAMKRIEDRKWEIKKELAMRIKQQLRRVPELKLFLDDTLDNVFKMEELFKNIKKDQPPETGDDIKNADNNL